MRIAIVVHAFPTHACGGVEVHAASLARSLVEAGHDVGVFAGERTGSRAPLLLRNEGRDGFDVTCIELPPPTGDVEHDFDPPGVEAVFGRWLSEHACDVVHVEHWMKLGPGIVRAAARAGLPVTAAAHDLWPITARYTALAPDMTPLAAGERTVADTAMLARCDLAERFLSGIARLGDAHGHVLPAELEPDEARSLAAILHGDPAEAGIGPEAFARAVRARRRVELARREVARATDLLLAPTEWLADELRARCPAGTRIEVDANGIDLRPFEGGRARDDGTGADAGVRFAYCGAILRQKGVHVLLEASGSMRAQLAVHGASTDAVWSARIARECRRAGATWAGAFDRANLAPILRAADVLVVPSIWPENAPLVVREAFAARVPVVASRIGAMAESVRDGVDGILVEPGDARALRAAMERFVARPGLVADLRAGIRPPRSIEDQAAGLVERWTELAGSRPRARVALPASVLAFAARVDRIAATDEDELVARVLGGLAHLRSRLLPREEPAARDAAWLRALGRSSLVQRLARAEEESRWLRTVASGREGEIAHLVHERRALLEAKESLERECAWRADTERDMAARAAWVEPASQAHADEAQWLRRVRTALEAERDWLRASVSDLRARVDEHAHEQAERDREIAWRRATDESRERELAWRRESAGETGRELQWRRENAREHEREIERLRALSEEQERENAGLRQALDIARARGLALETRIEELRAAREVLWAEARWREREMEDVRRSLERGRFRIVGRTLRARALAWPARNRDGGAS